MTSMRPLTPRRVAGGQPECKAMTLMFRRITACAMLASASASPLAAQVAVRGKTIHTMAGASITDGVVIIRDGKISAIGAAAEIHVPEGFRVLEAAVVTPGVVDAHSTVGLSGILNQKQDQDQLERSTAIQPELRAIDAYNPQDPLIAWIRSFGVTTIHTGHAPGELIAGQTLVVKTKGNTVEEALVVEPRAIAATLSSEAEKEPPKSPGTRGKMVAMLRTELIKAREYLAKASAAKATASDRGDGDGKAGAVPAEPPQRDLRLETLGQLLDGKLPLLVTANRAQDIASALRLAKEFQIRLWLDGAAEAYLLVDEIKAAGVPVIVHPTMARAVFDRENLSFETAAKLNAAGIPVALQSGYESYVPKTRVVLFEAALAAANGLGFEQALATITIDAARILEIDGRVGSLAIGKDGDLALYDGDPFEYTSHCLAVVIDGKVVSERPQ